MRTHLQHQTQEEVEVICTFFFREIIFHENFRVNATIKVEDSLCQKILRKCLNLFPCDEVLGETFYRVRHKCQARNNIFFQSNPVKKGF